MKCVLLMLDHCPLTSVSGPMEILSLANSLVPVEQRLSLRLISHNGEPIQCLGGLSLSVHGGLKDVDYADLIILGAIGEPTEQALQFSSEVLRWLRHQYQQGAKIASICTGAFLLAASGLLNGKVATTHWSCSAQFRQLYPQVKLCSERMITQQDNVYCSAGASAYQDMSVYLIAELYGRDVAQQCSKAALIDLDRYQHGHGQLQYCQYQPLRKHSDALVHGLQDWLREHLSDNISIAQLAEKVHLSERQLVRRFKQAVSDSPLAYRQQLRIEEAKYALTATPQTVDGISRLVGYEDVRFFRQLFKRHSGLSPSDYRQKFTL